MNSSQKLTFREKAGYGCGDFASVLFWATISNWLLYFYTDVFGISASAAGLMILVSRIWDGVNDPMMGLIADRTNTRWGKYRPYLMWMAIPMGVIATLTFSTPDLGATGKLIYAWVTYMLFMMTYTAINIPYSSLLGVITADTEERTSVAFYKYVFALTSSGVVSLVGLPLAKNVFGTDLAMVVLGHPSEAFGWQVMMGLFSLVAVGFFLITFASVKERVQPPPKQKSSVGRDLKDLLANPYWLIVLFGSLFMILFIAVRMSVTTHYFKYYVADQSITLFGHRWTFGFVALSTVFSTIGGWMGVVGIIATQSLTHRLGKRTAFFVFMLISVVCTAFFYVLPPDALYLIFGLQVVGSFFGGPMCPLIWAMFADIADYGEFKNGRRSTGLIFSASSMSQKMAWAISGFTVGGLLTAVGYQPNVEATPEVKHGLVLMMSLIPAASGIIAIAVMSVYRLDRKKMTEISEVLKERRDASATAQTLA